MIVGGMMWAFSVITSIWQEMIATIGALFTVVLAGLYYLQYRTLDGQSDILKEQQKMSKLEQTPYLYGPYDVEYDNDEQKIYFSLSNSASGPAENIDLFLIVNTRYSNHQIENRHIPTCRADSGLMEPTTVFPDEREVNFVGEIENLSTEVVYENSSDTVPVSDLMSHFDDETVSIQLRITYTDRFGADESPYGREYTLKTRKHNVSADENMGFEDLLGGFELASVSYDEFGDDMKITTE